MESEKPTKYATTQPSAWLTAIERGVIPRLTVVLVTLRVIASFKMCGERIPYRAVETAVPGRWGREREEKPTALF